ncbi:stage V sporulation protein S [Campylobacter canadensis]|uniref:Stage V sporulation protein S n=1 Tax=Campylobacter canadensis TaxID=449520 RepID=A0ABS7WS43_9BACT|nr:stage V sporulation protein S [Campylobacter canadensis]MBZ7987328.1 stage V sporulation protein S [Campylobacter canadensis]MBZ7994789.1 stage V sporulation protein S [Campylobacter canadensis]MBZ7996503.1 stage V sporulation protein S [Campylobacter canadensis]MBZ7998501.1 stage V sporulation protein S [Campylobacter canadensis]MBZ8000216.1 stage V sporulation protein S [Campylobacter canadensis]
MKNIFLMILLTINVLAIDKEAIEQKIKALSDARVILNSSDIDMLNNPFYQVVTNKSQQNTEPVLTFTLSAIVEKRAKINNKWYEVNEEIDGSNGYKVVSIKNDIVGISNSNNYKELNLKDFQNVQIN